MRNEQIITKGVYGFSQIPDFISVKNYIFMHYGDEICLAIRFSNETDYVFDSMRFCVIQIDAKGKVIAKTNVEYKRMDFKPGSTYSANKGIVVEKQCVDFKIQFYEAYSSYYRYVVRNGRVIIYYDRKKAEKMASPYSSAQAEPSVIVKRKKCGKPGLSAFAAILALLIMAGYNIYYLFSIYADMYLEQWLPQPVAYHAVSEEESLSFGVEYAEI